MRLESHKDQFVKSLLYWYQANKRALPWRETRDPYIIWVSEIILQQTTVNQGLPYFLRFIQKFPDIASLAKASEDDVLKMWQGLGYYSRARNLHHTAKHIFSELDNEFPSSYEEILKLKGVGPYTAAAISSFAFKLSHPVLDGNVLRFISRILGSKNPIDLNSTRKTIEGILKSLISIAPPDTFNQAIMEFGALNCTYKNPKCDTCTFAELCIAKQEDTVNLIPIKSKKIKKKSRFFYYFIFNDSADNTIIRKRDKNDIWKGLYEFPKCEVDSFNEAAIVPNELNLKIQHANIIKSKIYKQNLTHQRIHVQFINIELPNILNTIEPNQGQIVNKKSLNKYAWPKVIDLYFNDLSLTLF